MHRRAGITGILLFGAVALAGCGATHAAAAKGPVTVDLWESHAGGPVAQTEAALVKKFNVTHRTVHVQLVVTKASKKTLAAIQAGSPPLFVEISHYDGTFLRAHALQSLNGFINGPHGFSHSALASFYPGVLQNGVRNGQHYRLQADVKVSEFFYNKNLFQKAGITATPTTWNQLSADLVKLKALGVIPLAFKDASAHIEPVFLSNGGHLFKPGTHDTSTAYDSPAGIATFQFFRNLYKHGLMEFAHGTTIRSELASGKLAIGDATSAGYVKSLAAVGGKFPLGAFAYPAGISGHSGNIAQGLGFAILTHHTKAQQLAAWTFAQWFESPKQQAYWAMHSGFAPVTRAAVQYIPAAWLSQHPGMAVSIKEMASPYTVPRPAPDGYREVDAALDTAFFNAVTGKQPVKTTLKTLDAQDHGYLTGASAL